jgi:hypothetical protein
MGKPKSFLSTLTVEHAKASHNCRFNKAHRIARGEKRLAAKEGRNSLKYCRVCAIYFLKLDIQNIQKTLTLLEDSGNQLPGHSEEQPG